MALAALWNAAGLHFRAEYVERELQAALARNTGLVIVADEPPTGAGRIVGARRSAGPGWTGIQPALHPEPYVFVTVPEPPPDLEPFAFIREDEGITLVVTRGQADQAGLPYQYVAARVTLTIGSALSATGLTATVSRVLASAGISCNVIAGFHHDHLFVEWDRGADAAALLRQL